MEWKIFLMSFVSVFLAELGDKTQITTLLFCADNPKCKWTVFLSASLALVLSSFLAMFFGSFITKYISSKIIKISSGIVFILIGFFLLIKN